MTLDIQTLPLLILVAALALALGWLAGSRRGERLNVELRAQLDAERRALGEQKSHMETTITALSARALHQNNQAFLELAQETLKQFHVLARGELEKREKAVEGLVKPIHEALEKTEREVRRMEIARQEAFGSLGKQIELIGKAHDELRGETRNLVQALRRPEVRGRWGELTLQRLVELAGLVEHCDFYPQEPVTTADGLRRPDMIVRLPAGREIVIDVKTPLDAYLSAIEATDEGERRRHLESHARTLRERVRELAAKAYWNQFRNAPDFVVLFIPGDQFLAAALDIDHGLLEEALAQKVILATPTSLVALLRAVAFGWRQEQLAENAERIRTAGEELYNRLAVFTEHLARLGGSLDASVTQFNKAVSSFDSRVLPGARRFTEMGVHAKKPLEPVRQIESNVRELPPETGNGDPG